MRRMMLAGIGALSYTHEEWEKFMDKMVERGEATHQDHVAQVKEIRERRGKFMHDRKGYARERVSKALKELNLPTKSDFEKMDAKIAALDKKVDDLNKKTE